jgi:hypothetical protein
MKTKTDIEVKICEIENEISKENEKEVPSPIRIGTLEVSLRILKWVLE